MSDLDKFLEERGKIPIPSGDVARIKLLAKELALGVHRKLWGDFITHNPRYGPRGENLTTFYEKRWKDSNFMHDVDLLMLHEYLYYDDGVYRLLNTVVRLLNETEPYNVFISYKRSESSALALLVNTKLREHSLVPFVDMALEAGGNWHADLEGRIKTCDYFIILLGKESLASDMTVKEIAWAIQYEKTVIPVWHSGFDLDSDQWEDVDLEVKEAIQQTNAIRVIEESASDYNRVIVELLNRFGITP